MEAVMQIDKALIILAFSSALPMAAQAWEQNMERGVDLYEATDGPVLLSLVCDPNTVYGTTESAVMVGIGTNHDMTAPVSFRFPDLITIDALMDHGRIAKATNEGGIWEPLLAGFRAHGSVTVTVGDNTYDVNLGEPKVFTCL